MALVKSVYEAAINAAFQLPVGSTWAGCAAALATATKTYIESGTINTTVNGTVIPPWIIPYQAAGIGIGVATTIPASVTQMQTNLTALFLAPSTLWAQIGPVMANEINNVVSTSIINTTDTTILTGVGTGVATTAPGLGALITGLTLAWTVAGTSWTAVASTIATAVDAFLRACVINTSDSGTSPPLFWTGFGVGSIS